MLHKTKNTGRPDYYITPTRDFTQYTKDSEEKYWSQDTKFDWGQNVEQNLKEHLAHLHPKEFSKVTFMVLPMIVDNIEYKITQIEQSGLPWKEDALKDIGECIPSGKASIDQALLIQSPLQQHQLTLAKLNDQLDILQSELVDLQEQHRLGLVRNGTQVKHLETETERQEQNKELDELTHQIAQVKGEYQGYKKQYKNKSAHLKTKIRSELRAVEPKVLSDLKDSRNLLKQILESGTLPEDEQQLSQLKDLILKRQMRGLKDIANHALVVEQSAIAPLTMGIIHYKRYREIQEALTTFINDEAKHSATFRRFLAEKLEAKEYISAILIKGADRYMWLARFMPSAGLFLAVIVEAIGAAYLEFFGDEKYMPDKLFCSISKTISEQDETRHMDLCVAMYNELFRKGTRWERIRNKIALQVMLKSVYGDKTDDHHLIQAFRAFGVESELLYNHIMGRLSQQLARISVYVEPEELLKIIGRK